MSILELLLLALGVSMDAFAVAVCKGLAMDECRLRHALIPGLWFGGFQGLMPLIGWFLGSRFEKYITTIDHWIAFALLVAIGANMLREALGKEDGEETDASLSVRVMFPMALATSIDALAVGISFAFLEVHIVAAVGFIAVVTFLLSMVGVKVGNVFGMKYKTGAEVAGGVILILLGVKILLEHLGVIAF